MRQHPAVEQSTRLATDTFGPRLLLAFVGGSHAAGTPSQHSDIDVFVLLDRANPILEATYSAKLRELHTTYTLHFDHCGEIFDVTTLDTLLSNTERALSALPELQHVACYQGDCALSVFRKGDVVFKFLADPKISVRGDRELLAALERRAIAYFTRHPMPRVQEQKGRLDVPPGPEATLLERFAARAGGTQWTDTPVGVDLGRWFGTPLPAELDTPAPAPVRNVSAVASRRCPLHVLPGHDPAVPRLKGQCLAHIPPEGGASA